MSPPSGCRWRRLFRNVAMHLSIYMASSQNVEGGALVFAVRLRLKCDGTRAETRFRLSAKRTSPFKSAWVSVRSTTGSRGVRISGSNVGYTVFRGSVKGTGYPLHSPASSSIPLPCVTVCHHISPGLSITSHLMIGMTILSIISGLTVALPGSDTASTWMHLCASPCVFKRYTFGFCGMYLRSWGNLPLMLQEVHILLPIKLGSDLFSFWRVSQHS